MIKNQIYLINRVSKKYKNEEPWRILDNAAPWPQCRWPLGWLGYLYVCKDSGIILITHYDLKIITFLHEDDTPYRLWQKDLNYFLKVRVPQNRHGCMFFFKEETLKGLKEYCLKNLGETFLKEQLTNENKEIRSFIKRMLFLKENEILVK